MWRGAMRRCWQTDRDRLKSRGQIGNLSHHTFRCVRALFRHETISLDSAAVHKGQFEAADRYLVDRNAGVTS